MAKSKLSDEAKGYVVRALACFIRGGEIQEALKKEFEVEITLQAIEAYDPHKVAGAKLSKHWRELFDATRKAFVEDVDGIGIAHQSVRLRTLERVLSKAEKQGNAALVAQLVEQAAKEVGGLFTNRRQLTGANGKPLFPAKPITDNMTPAEAAEAYAASREAIED